jgi:hemerythrin
MGHENILWNEKMSVGVTRIDEHHKQLLGIMVKLRNTMQAGKDREEMHNILSDLVSYSKYHFSAEERLMQTYRYGQYEKHKKEHDDYVAKISDFLLQFGRGDKKLPDDLFGFLRQWLVEHILNSDQTAFTFLRKKGV